MSDELFCRAVPYCVVAAIPQVGEMIKDREGVVHGGMTGKGLKVCASLMIFVLYLQYVHSSFRWFEVYALHFVSHFSGW